MCNNVPVNRGKEASEAGRGTRIGRYTLRHLIGHGGMASVYLADGPQTHAPPQHVAVKLLYSDLANEERIARMFLDEARLSARIEHPNVCAVLEHGAHGGVPYLVMEYLHGESLHAVLERLAVLEQGDANARGVRLPLWLAARTLADAARGLDAAHELVDDHGRPLEVVHRDISPENIVVLYGGTTKVVDFGIARAHDRLTVTQTGEMKGKLAYMAPEQMYGETLDRRADLWSLGVVLWEMTLGQHPFTDRSDANTALNIANKPLPAARQLDPHYPEQLEHVLHSLLQRDPRERPASARSVAAALERYLEGLPRASGRSEVAQWMESKLWHRRRERERRWGLESVPDDTVPHAPDAPELEELEGEPTVAQVEDADGGTRPRGGWQAVQTEVDAAPAAAADWDVPTRPAAGSTQASGSDGSTPHPDPSPTPPRDSELPPAPTTVREPPAPAQTPSAAARAPAPPQAPHAPAFEGPGMSQAAMAEGMPTEAVSPQQQRTSPEPAFSVTQTTPEHPMDAPPPRDATARDPVRRRVHYAVGGATVGLVLVAAMLLLLWVL
jgi:serine/threonine-protein kinase